MNRLGPAPRIDNFDSLSTNMWLAILTERLNTYSGATDPVASEVPEGQWVIHFNTTTSKLKLWTKISVSSSHDDSGGGGGGEYAFSVYRGTSDQVLTNATYTKAQFNTEIYDADGLFNSATTYVWTAPIDGIFHFDWGLYLVGSTATDIVSRLNKNSGTNVGFGSYAPPVTAAGGGISVGSKDIQVVAGDTVHVDGYVAAASGWKILSGADYRSYFSGHLVKAS